MPCGIPAPANHSYASSWCGIPAATADDCFFSLDLTLTATPILELFSQRWPLEVGFRDVKQFLGFEDPQNRVAPATTRTAPLIFCINDLVLLWTRRRDTD
jgi:hypothetical protein